MGPIDDQTGVTMTPKCVASAAHDPLDTLPETGAGRQAGGLFKSAQWSADGTTVVTNSEDNTIRSYVL